MSQSYDSNYRTFTAAGAIPQYARCTLGSGGTITVSGLAEIDVGTAQTEAFASGDVISVKLRSAAGTHKMIAIEATDAGELLYTEAAGKVQVTAQATAYVLGNALEAATADGDIIEVLYSSHGDTAAT
jgi:hypothetical protein